MTFTEQQITKMKENMKEINNYIETNILPYIDYQFETGKFGPREVWGRCGENSGSRYSIRLNDYSRKINYCYAGVPHTIEENMQPKHMIVFIEYWKDAKMYLNVEIQELKRKDEIINSFEI
jgi:hypothetical protein